MSITEDQMAGVAPGDAAPPAPAISEPLALPFGLARVPILGAALRHRELRRVIAFLIAGGISAIVTITVTSVMTDLEHQRFFWSALAGTELGILVNFGINDRLAFRDLDGHRRILPARLARFHVTSATGQTLIFLISLLLYDVAHWFPMFAQALPIVLVTGVNFAMHRFWTYRGSKHR